MALPSRRLRDWQSRLAALVAQRWAMPFAWGVHDCCLFAADAVLAVTGHDPAADLRGTYRTAAEAVVALARAGGLAGLAIERAGRVVPAEAAQAGDIGLLEPGRGALPALAVCAGTHWLAPGRHGLVAHPAHHVRRAWRCTRGGGEVPAHA